MDAKRTKYDSESIHSFIDNYHDTTMSLMKYACLHQRFDVIQYLVNKGVHICNKDLLLHDACYNSNYPIAKYLIDHGVHILSKDRLGHTPLYVLCSRKESHPDEIKILDLLLQDVVHTISGFKSLCLASKNGRLDFVKSLFRAGVNLNHGGKKRWYRANPLCTAIMNNHIDIAYYLIDNGTNVNRQTYHHKTPLMCAREKGYNELAEYLILHGAER